MKHSVVGMRGGFKEGSRKRNFIQRFLKSTTTRFQVCLIAGGQSEQY